MRFTISSYQIGIMLASQKVKFDTKNHIFSIIFIGFYKITTKSGIIQHFFIRKQANGSKRIEPVPEQDADSLFVAWLNKSLRPATKKRIYRKYAQRIIIHIGGSRYGGYGYGGRMGDGF